MKTYCPVAGCSYIVKGADDGWEHWQDCDDLHRKLHINWLNFFRGTIIGGFKMVSTVAVALIAGSVEFPAIAVGAFT